MWVSTTQLPIVKSKVGRKAVVKGSVYAVPQVAVKKAKELFDKRSGDQES